MAAVVIERYKRGELNPVSTLYHLSQTVPLELEFKETVTTGEQMHLNILWHMSVFSTDVTVFQMS